MLDGYRLEASIASPDGLAAAIREARRARRSRDGGSPPGEGRSPRGPASWARGGRILERLLLPGDGGPPTVDGRLARVATMFQIRSRAIDEMMTSMPVIRVAPPVAAALAAVLVELLHYVDVCSRHGRGMRVWVAVGWSAGDLTLAVACPLGATLGPVPTADAADAYRRACRLARLLGGCLHRGIRDGSMLFGMMVPMREVADADLG